MCRCSRCLPPATKCHRMTAWRRCSIDSFLRVRSQNLEGFHFQQLLRIGLEHEKRLLGDAAPRQVGRAVRRFVSQRHLAASSRAGRSAPVQATNFERVQSTDGADSQRRNLSVRPPAHQNAEAVCRVGAVRWTNRSRRKRPVCSKNTSGTPSSRPICWRVWSIRCCAAIVSTRPVRAMNKDAGRCSMNSRPLRFGPSGRASCPMCSYLPLRSLGELQAALQSDGSEESLRAVSEIDSPAR